MIVITGGSGFIGSNLVKALNAAGRTDLLVVDDLRDGTKIVNLADCDISDYLDKDDYLEAVQAKRLDKPDAIVHLGACSDTTEWDGVFMMKNNYEYSRELLGYCLGARVPFIYASSASVYGHGRTFKEDRQFEEPANLYAYSKFLFDQYVRRILPEAQSQVAGLRYFNVYGPRERHKGRMASVALHFHDQVRDTGAAKLFGEYDDCKAGEHRRDFVHVDDTVAVKTWLLENPGVSGIFNVGTGQASTYNAMARAVIKNRGFGEIAYIQFPEDLKGRYQSFTEADLSALRAAGYDGTFRDVEQGVDEYMSWLAADTR